MGNRRCHAEQREESPGLHGGRRPCPPLSRGDGKVCNAGFDRGESSRIGVTTPQSKIKDFCQLP